MDIFSGIILGVVQGLTEFLPISSSGHLILAREVLGLQTEFGLSFDAVLQLATSLAVLVYFRKDCMRIAIALGAILKRQAVEKRDKILLLAIVLGTIPGVVLGLLLEDTMATTFRSAELVAWTLIFGSILFFLAEKVARQNESLSVKKGLWIGFFQVLALIPGMSRSGVTISGGLFLGLKREDAARFSFLLAFPIIFGSGVRKLFELNGVGALGDIGTSLFAGGIAAFVVGMLTIHYLLRYLRNHTLTIFIIYRLALAGTIFILI